MSIQQMLLGASGASGYLIDKSLRFRASASAYLNRTPASAGNRKTWTWSGWVKRGSLGSAGSIFHSYDGSSSRRSAIQFNSDNTIGWDQGGSSTSGLIDTVAVFRDPSAWYHLVCVADYSNGTAANRAKIYVNNVLQSVTTADDFEDADGFINSTNQHQIGSYGASVYFDGYLAEVNFIDGQALTPASFGSTNALTGVWQPAPYTGTYGTNGFYLKFTDNSTAAALGTDFSGNSNTWTVNNISVTAGVTYDSMTDVPTLTNATTANYCVLNPLAANATLSNANLTVTGSSGTSTFRHSTLGLSSGKWYAEMTAVDKSGTNTIGIGIYSLSAIGVENGTKSRGYFHTGEKYSNGSLSSYGNSFTTSDVIGIAVDVDAGKVWFSKNGTWQASGDPAAGTNAAFTDISNDTWFTTIQGGNTYVVAANFGQRPFAYTPPTGFVALNTFNLPTSTIVKGNTVMDATLYTGTLLSNAITNAAAFQPDLVWIKSRSAATDHELTDSVRGVTKSLTSNSTAAEATDAQGLTAFNSGGFTVGTNTTYNNLAATYVAWQWKASGTSSSNTAGTITSTVSVNATAGFSVVTYTGTGSAATVGHGLGVAPKMIIVKNRNSTFTWRVYHSSIGNGNVLYLSATDASTAEATAWNSTTPASSVFSVGTSSGTNGSTNTYVAYCWSEIDGFSKFGVYTGNSNADGPFIYCGFRPKFVLFKGKTFANNWYMIDSSTNTINVAGAGFKPNAADAEIATSTSENAVDFLSNGFKLRNNAAAVAFNNSSGQEFVYAAFAENPFKNSLAR